MFGSSIDGSSTPSLPNPMADAHSATKSSLSSLIFCAVVDDGLTLQNASSLRIFQSHPIIDHSQTNKYTFLTLSCCRLLCCLSDFAKQSIYPIFHPFNFYWNHVRWSRIPRLKCTPTIIAPRRLPSRGRR